MWPCMMAFHVNENINIKIFTQIIKWSHTVHILQELMMDIQQHVVLPVKFHYVKYLIN